ncbi:MAG: hypothetical protein H0V01_00235 [Bacteroidetes bacterium]|nr:hypothetical protein [Bacteroidota bacterium]HET6244947.1 hypothetical protein [Bacteroidia bacterium]
MKNIFLSIVVLLTIHNKTFSQISTASSSEVSAFKKAVLYVVLQGNTTTTNVKYTKVVNETEVETENKEMVENVESEYNKAMRFAMKNLWKINKFEYITEAEFEEKKFDVGSYFLFAAKHKTEDKEPITLNYLIIAQGDKKAKKVGKMKWLAALPLSFDNVSDQYYNYKIPGLVQFLQNHIEFVFTNGIAEQKKVLSHYNSKTKEIKDGVLYVLAEDLTAKVYSEEAIAKIFKGEVKIVDQKQINTAIKKQDPNVLYFHKIGPEKISNTGTCLKYILSAKGGELLYISEHKISKGTPEGLLESDFKQFNK